MTETLTEPITDNIFDFNEFKDFQEAAARPERLAPGSYYIKLPSTLSTLVRKDGYNRVGFDIPLGQMRIVGDKDGNAVLGYTNRYYTISTLPRGSANFADAVDFMRLFGIDPATLKGATLEETRDRWQAALDILAGQRSPKPIRFTYVAKFKHPVSGKYVHLKAKDLRVGDDYASVGYVVDGTFTLTPTFPEGVTEPKDRTAYAKAQGWTVVYANFEPGYRAWAAK